MKQSPGIEYNELLNRIASDYSGLNSARAALSRTLKDMAALGFVQRQGTKLFVTDKGLLEINSEMKNKLLLKLNYAVNSKEPVSEIDSIVKMLHALIERSKADTDLLKAAKSSSGFYISDLIELKNKTDERTKLFKYLSSVLMNQISSLKDLNFNDFRKISLSDETIPMLLGIVEKQGTETVAVECSNNSFFADVKEKFAVKQDNHSLLLEKSLIKDFLEKVKDFPQTEKNTVKIYLPSMQVKIQNPDVFLIAPHSHLKKL